MSKKLKLQLRKDLEKYHSQVKGWTRQDLTAGRWFPKFLETTLASHTGGRTPEEVKAGIGESEDVQDLVDDIVSKAIHRAIAVTDAYDENLTGTEIRALKEKKATGTPQKLVGDSIPLIAELLYVLKIYLDLMFDIAAAHEKVMVADVDKMGEVLARSLGHFDVDATIGKPDFFEKVGAKIFARAIAQTVGSPVADALRKGFFCYLGKAIAKTLDDTSYLESLEPWVAAGPETGPMLSVDPDDELAFDPMGY
ncbi:MAG: hypothetical protein ACYS22_13170 [Planctomycetota bacterium]|jgi:hypothetical protein